MTHCPSTPRVLSIAGTDPTGGAGAQADIKSISAAGGFALSVTTAVVAQNTRGVRAVHPVPVDILRAQCETVIDDVTVDAVKIGMLGDRTTVETIADILAGWPDHIPVVLDPVMVAASGDRLCDDDGIEALRSFVACASVVTPNIPELALLVGAKESTTFEEAEAQAAGLAADKDVIVIVKGGHLTGADAGVTVVEPSGASTHIPAPRIDTPHTHGTGCSLSSALATRLGAGEDPVTAMRWVTGWLTESIRYAAALEVGQGHGPIDHFHQVRRQAAAADTRPWGEWDTVIRPSDDPQQWIDTGRRHVDAPAPAIAPAGPWTAALWEATGTLWRDITASEFVTRLGDGSLDEDDFAFYLDQDAYYLDEYSRALSALSVLAPDLGDRMGWAADAQGCGIAEKQLHDTYLAGRTRCAGPSPVTSAYTSFLTATVTADEYAVGAAAVLPCAWLYMEIGLALSAATTLDGHPYEQWLAEYSSPEFEEATRQCVDRVERALAAAGPQARARAARAYLLACRHEWEFFEQSSRRR